jgi:hypothetical protein
VPPTSAYKVEDTPSIVFPFPSIVKLYTDQLSPSAILTICPNEGVGGKLIVKLPAEVSAIN